MWHEKQANILVVDDMPDKLLAIQAVLEELGQNVICVTSGREALRALLQDDFAVILLDINMPGMDGFETAALIRERKKSEHTPIIFLTSHSDEHFMWQGYSLGAVDYIMTPVVPEVLRAKVSVFVDLFRKTEQVKRQAEQQVALAREQAARAAAEQASRRADFLADASDSLARSLDYQATVAALLRAGVPFLCDAALLAMLSPHGKEWQIDLGHMHGDGMHGDGWTQELLPESDLEPSTLALFERILSQRGAELAPDGGVAFKKAMPALESPSALVAPLVARGRTLGVLCLARSTSGRRFSREDVRLAEDFAGRGAMALDNARLYRALQEADRRKDEFLAMLGHELRNPLGAVSNALAVLSMAATQAPPAGDPGTTRLAHGILERQVRQMERLIDDLLDVSRITRGKIQLRKQVTEIQPIVHRAIATVEPLIRARNHELSVTLPDEPMRIVADPARIEQVMTNLLNNAAKYTEPGGRISLRADREGEWSVLRVRDTGVGMSPELLHQVFDMFVQGERSLDRSQGGLGIGLTLVRSLVEMHGGSVQAVSAGANQGSEFIVRLPTVAQEAAPRDESPSRPQASGPGAARRVLVVDDNPDLISTMRMLLENDGHEVYSAENGPAAVRLAQECGPEVVLIDLGLPEMDGFEVARRIRALPELEHATLVAMTGYGQPEDRRKTREAGFDHHLVKPVPYEHLQTLMRDLSPSVQAG